MGKKGRALALTLAVVIVATPLLILHNIETESWRVINKAQGELKALGYPLTVAELEATKPKPEDNAESIYRKLIDEYATKGFGYRTYGGVPKGEEAATLDREVAFIDQVDEVTTKPRLWFSRNYGLGKDMSKLELVKLHDISRLVGRRAILDASRGQEDNAYRRLRTMTALSEHVSQDPTYTGGLVSRSLYIVRDQTALGMARARPNVNFQTRLRRLIESVPARFEPKQYLGAEAVSFSQDQPIPEGPHDYREPWEDFLLKQPFMKRRYRALGLEGVAEMAKVSQDGLDSSDLTLIEAIATTQLDRDPFCHLLPNPHLTVAPMITTAYVEQRNALVLAAFDVLIERSGGPKAKLPPSTRLERKGDRWALIGPLTFVEFSKDQIRQSETRYWHGFTP